MLLLACLKSRINTGLHATLSSSNYILLCNLATVSGELHLAFLFRPTLYVPAEWGCGGPRLSHHGRYRANRIWIQGILLIRYSETPEILLFRVPMYYILPCFSHARNPAQGAVAGEESPYRYLFQPAVSSSPLALLVAGFGHQARH